MKNNTKDSFKTPILFLIFNRPEVTRRVFNKIKEVKPQNLFIAADGPRENVKQDDKNCRKTRDIVNNIDWNCEVKKLFREKNLGCKRAVSSAIDWFFDNVEMGIVLEDDCLPDKSFFFFCQKLLKKYEKDFRIFQISGTNFIEKWQIDTPYSYYFSRYGSIWGWATWKNRWEYYDVNIKKYSLLEEYDLLDSLFNSRIEKLVRIKSFKKINKNLDTWDYQWIFTKLINNGLTIIPKKNLISNIGFNQKATHTKKENLISNLSRGNINFPLSHPDFCFPNRANDKLFTKKVSAKPMKVLKLIIKDLLK